MDLNNSLPLKMFPRIITPHSVPIAERVHSFKCQSPCLTKQSCRDLKSQHDHFQQFYIVRYNCQGEKMWSKNVEYRRWEIKKVMIVK